MIYQYFSWHGVDAKQMIEIEQQSVKLALFNTLPVEIKLHIVWYVRNTADMYRLMCTSQAWYNAVNCDYLSDYFWKMSAKSSIGNESGNGIELNKEICLKIAKQSCVFCSSSSQVSSFNVQFGNVICYTCAISRNLKMISHSAAAKKYLLGVNDFRGIPFFLGIGRSLKSYLDVAMNALSNGKYQSSGGLVAERER